MPVRRVRKFDREYGIIYCIPEQGEYSCVVLGMESLRICLARSKRLFEPGEIVEKEGNLYIKHCRVKKEEALGNEAALKKLLVEYIKRNYEAFLGFVNYSGMYSKTKHYLELLPGIGRATRRKIEENRPYKSLEEVKEKVKVDIIEAIVKRLIAEILNEVHEKIFLRRPRAV